MEDAFQETIDSERKVSTGYNSYWDFAITKEVIPAYLDYMYHNPTTALKILQKSYPIFWLPAEDGVANYGMKILSLPFFNIIRKSISMVVTFNKLVIHSLSFVTFIALIIFSQHKSPQKKTFLYAFSCFLYMSFFCCIGDAGENNRYRFAIEPIIWILPFLTIPNLSSLLKERSQLTLLSRTKV
jgi:hypothetical protein